MMICRAGLWNYDRLRRFLVACRWLNKRLSWCKLPTNGILITKRREDSQGSDWVSEGRIPPEGDALVRRILASCRVDLERSQETGWGAAPFSTIDYAETAALCGMEEEVRWARQRLSNAPLCDYLPSPAPIVMELRDPPFAPHILQQKVDQDYPRYDLEVVQAMATKWHFEAASLALAGDYDRAKELALNNADDMCGEDAWFVDCLFAWKFPERVFDDYRVSPRDGTHDMRVPTTIVEYANRSAWCECEILLSSIANLSEVGIQARLKLARGIAGRIPSDLYPMI